MKNKRLSNKLFQQVFFNLYFAFVANFQKTTQNSIEDKEQKFFSSSIVNFAKKYREIKMLLFLFIDLSVRLIEQYLYSRFIMY